MRPGMTFTVESIVLSGTREIELLRDGFTVVTQDRKPGAHVRHTVAMTGTGVDVLRNSERASSETENGGCHLCTFHLCTF